jgi:RES domain-containing protein
MVYASESLALCLAECLVHLPGALPEDYVAYRLDLPEAAVEPLDASRPKAGWSDDIGYTRAIGDQWIAQSRSLALAVPSAVIIESTNMLINPAHPAATGIEVTIQEFRFDPRLRPYP